MKDPYGNSRRFYVNQVGPMIKEKFGPYEDRIAVGIAGEGSDCFGYDDFISRDHDFGTGVCLWISDRDMEIFGNRLKEEYDELVKRQPGNNLTVRLSQRRGVMTIHDYYSNILGIDCDTDNCSLSEMDWRRLDHTCLATAVNGEVFRDDLGDFSAFRKLLLDYYPDNIWKMHIVNELHKFSASLQVNYARCMTRGDIVAARLCHMQGLEAGMELYFLMKKKYAPYYKWTFRRLSELDDNGRYSSLIKELAMENLDYSLWEGQEYRPNILNMDDPIIMLTERIAGCIVAELRKLGFTDSQDPYLEFYVNTVLDSMN
ncbi:MAG: DUF4037 domain-containing protein [Eubacterium sp.]|nr:DUF4037 domain-containing protein [Eubacterium sp.]